MTPPGMPMTVYEYGDPAASTVLVQPVDEHELSAIAGEIDEIKRLSTREFRLLAVKIGNWNRDLSPWEAPAVFGKEDFGAGAEDTLQEILKICSAPDKTYIIGGYSLAGLFSLWSVYRTGRFAGAAAASPSVWFPGFIDHMKSHEVLCGKVYLSLGDQEEKTRNPVMATVGNRIREAHELLKARGTDTVLEWNEGNHFQESGLRTAKAFAWVLDRIS